MTYVNCPHCGATLSVPEEYKNDKRLHCSQCNQNFENDKNILWKAPKVKPKPTPNQKNAPSEELSLKGKIITTIVIFIIAFIAYGACEGGGIKVDGKTVYVVTENYYAPATEAAAKRMVNSAVENQHDAIGFLETMYENEREGEMTHLFEGEKVVVVKEVSTGYKVRKLSDFTTAIIPNKTYLREENR
ncbi:hypothetical protein [Hoylesella timonensis]|uniref:hypothetical protein n=1 Tax=Hoylesella timonensis TaxID=386414 RepID=UPI0012E085C5|nr:hypothetical protein [Hoylesella timonensis]